MQGTNLRALFEVLDASDTVDVCRAIIIEDAIRDAEFEGGIKKIREQLIVNDGKMGTDGSVELDPMDSNWGMGDGPLPEDGLVG